MSLQLDTGNFKQAWIDGKKVNELWFLGEKIYDSTKFYALGNKWSGSSITARWGGTSKYVRPYNNTSRYIASCVGNTSPPTYKNTAICQTNRDLSKFTEVESGYIGIKRLKEIMGVKSLTQCKAVYYVTQFKNNTYSGDIFVKPFIRTKVYSTDKDYTLGGGYGIGTEYANNTPNDFCWTYKEAYKGKTVTEKFKLTDEQIGKLESGSYLTFFCMPYKTNSETTSTKATLYYGGYLLFEVD